jgi:hypothetical protein
MQAVANTSTSSPTSHPTQNINHLILIKFPDSVSISMDILPTAISRSEKTIDYMHVEQTRR